MPLRTYRYVCDCPCSDRCSPQAWKRAGVWGTSREDVKDKLTRHLMRNGVHLLSKSGASLFANLVEISYDDEEKEDEQQKEGRAADDCDDAPNKREQQQ